MDTMTNGQAPMHGPRGTRLGAKGGKVAEAWQQFWDRLSETDFRQGQEIAEDIAAEMGLNPQSIMAQVHIMAREGFLQREMREVPNTVQRAGGTFDSHRKRAFYRINTPRVAKYRAERS